MNEREMIQKIVDAWPAPGCRPSAELMRLSEEATQTFPKSAALWCLRGDLYQLATDPTLPGFDPNIPFGFYSNALVADDMCADAYNEIGYLYDVYFDDFERAASSFRKAIELGCGWNAYYGLARALAEDGRSGEALQLLRDCPYKDDPNIPSMIEEITKGIWRPTVEAESRK